MDARFAESWFHKDHRVLGCRLHPFCLEDALILCVAESPFLLPATSKVQYSLADLQLAATICSTPAEVFLSARFKRSWLGTLLWSFRCWRWCASEDGLRRQCQAFVNYVDDFYSAPDLWHEGDGELNAPWILSTIVFILHHTTYRPREVWTMPIGQAMWIAAALAEQVNPNTQIASEEEVEAMKAMEML